MGKHHNSPPGGHGSGPHSMGQAEQLKQFRAATLGLQKENAILGQKMEQYRRILWMVVSENNGRIELPEDVYRQTMAAPPNEVITKLEPDPKNKKVLLINCDEEGNELGRIIVPSGFGGGGG